MKSVLLTGATGFIGQRLQVTLLDLGYIVEALVRPDSTNKANLHPDVKAVVANLDDSDRLQSILAKTDAVIYCAGSVRGRKPEDFRPANINGVSSLVSGLNRAAKGTPFLLISSLAASRPEVSDYANSKFLGEQELSQNARFPWSIFRPPAVYGPGDKEMLPILKLARKGLVTPTGPRDQRLSLIHVDDVASAVVAWLQNWERCTGQIFGLDDGEPGGYTWQKIAKTAHKGRHLSVRIPRWLLSAAATINASSSRLLGYSPMLTPGKVRELTQPDWLCNNDALSAATGWAPQINFKQGLLTIFEKKT